MANINEILARAAALRDETALNSISPERAGGIMYDTLLALNELWLQQGAALVISKIYASVAAMEADTAPVSDLTGNPLRPGQIVVIASSDSDNGSVYRYNGTESPSWSLVGSIGNLDPVDSLDSDSTTLPLAAHQGKVLDGKISQLGQKVDELGRFEEDTEYIKVVTDSEGKIIEGVTADGEKVVNVPTTVNANLVVTGELKNDALQAEIDAKISDISDEVDAFIADASGKLSYIKDVTSPEWIRAVTDKDGKIIEGITVDGKKVVAVDTEYPNGIPSEIKEYIDNSIPEPTPTPQVPNISADSYNQLATDKCNDNKTYTFNMCEVEKGKVTLRYTITDYIAKIAIFGDLHVGLGYSEQVIWNNWENCIEQSLKWASDKYPYFGIAMGDQLSSMNSSIRNKGIRELLDYYNRIRPFNFPLFAISGNHDAAVPEFTHEGIIEIANVRIICFSATLDYSELQDPIGNVTDETYAWLASEVAKSYNAGYTTILACHYCLLITSGTGDWRGHINDHRNDIINLCSTYNVRLFISAHNHRSGLLHGIVSTEGGVDLDMTNVQFGMGGSVYSELIIDSEGFHFTEHEVSTLDHTEGDVRYYEISDDHITHTLFVPMTNQAQGTIYE